MDVTRTRFTLAGLTVQRLDFHPSTLTPDDLLPLAHAQQLTGWVTKRQAEHLAGRIAARAALRDAGLPECYPTIGAHREPLWPAGAIGSISHTEHIALAVATRQETLRHGLGLDGEILLSASTADEVAPGIISPDEQRLLASTNLPFTLALTLTFSAKESLFKALFPQVQAWFGFEAARVQAISHNAVQLALTTNIGPWTAGKVIYASACQHGPLVVTLVHCR